MSAEVPNPGAKLPSVVRSPHRKKGPVPRDGFSEPVQLVLDRLEDVTRSGASGWMARCPAHDDHEPSLSLGEGRDGRALVYCFAGCRTESVVESLGLDMADLFPRDATDASDDDGSPQKVRLVQYAEEKADLFCDQHDRPYAWIEEEGHHELWPLQSEKFKYLLYGLFHEKEGNVPDSGAVNNALNLLGYRAFRAERRELHNRFARHDGALWYDLGGPKWPAVRVTADGWWVEHDPPPLFRRFNHQKAQVEPEGGGNLVELLDPFLGMLRADDRTLFHVSLVAALLPDVPRAMPILHGPQGSAKTTLAKFFRAITDPSSTPIPRAPSKAQELAQLLDHHAVLCLDNLSRVDAATSDTLCRAVSGEGFSKRELYTDDEDILFEYRRQILLNGINIPARRADLLDRSILLSTRRIPPEKRREERELWEEFEAVRPRIFGAVLDTLSSALGTVDDVELGQLPRMADWARHGYAIADALGIGGETFLKAYARNRRGQNREALESHPVGAAVLAFMRGRDHWEGAPSRLLEQL